MKFLSTSAILAMAAADPVGKYCEFPEVMQCYKAPLKTCWAPFEEANKKTDAALKALVPLEGGIYDKMGPILEGNSEFNETFKIVKDEDSVWITTYAFQKLGLIEDAQLHLQGLVLLYEGSKDQRFADAATDMNDEFLTVLMTQCIDPIFQYAGANDTTVAKPQMPEEAPVLLMQ